MRGAGEGERILGKREEDKRKERGDRERMNGRTEWTCVVLLCLRVHPSRPLPPRSEFFSTCVMKRTNH